MYVHRDHTNVRCQIVWETNYFPYILYVNVIALTNNQDSHKNHYLPFSLLNYKRSLRGFCLIYFKFEGMYQFGGLCINMRYFLNNILIRTPTFEQINENFNNDFLFGYLIEILNTSKSSLFISWDFGQRPQFALCFECIMIIYVICHAINRFYFLFKWFDF